MRNITLYLLILFIASGCSNLKFRDPYTGFKARPKIVESSSFEFNRESQQEEFSSKTIFYFNEKGLTKNQQEVTNDSSKLNRWVYIYDKKGNMIMNTLLNVKGEPFITNKYVFNKYGQTLSREYFIDGQKKSVTTNNYDREKRTLEIVSRNSNGSFRNKTFQKFNSKSKVVESISYDSLGNAKNKIEFDYDEMGNQIESRWYNKDNQLFNIYKSIYNSNNDRIRILKYKIENGKNVLEDDTKTEYKYDLKGNCIEERIIVNDVILSIERNKIFYKNTPYP